MVGRNMDAFGSTIFKFKLKIGLNSLLVYISWYVFYFRLYIFYFRNNS